MYIAVKELGRGSGFVVAGAISEHGTLEWLMGDLLSCEWIDRTCSHVDAASWLVRIGRADWKYAEAAVDEIIAWSKRVIADQPIVLHDAQGSCNTTGACGQ